MAQRGGACGALSQCCFCYVDEKQQEPLDIAAYLSESNQAALCHASLSLSSLPSKAQFTFAFL